MYYICASMIILIGVSMSVHFFVWSINCYFLSDNKVKTSFSNFSVLFIEIDNFLIGIVIKSPCI